MFSDLHYSIARELISCANKHELIAYKDLCEKINYGGVRKIGVYLDPISKFTYSHYGIFISSIVILKGTEKNGQGFIKMYRLVTGDYATPESDIEEAQREKVYDRTGRHLLKKCRIVSRIRCLHRTAIPQSLRDSPICAVHATFGAKVQKN